MAFNRELEMRWPTHPDYPSYGYIITRFDLDQLVSEHAEKAGAVVWQGAEAVSPLASRTGNGSSGGNGTSNGSHAADLSTQRCGGAVVVDKARGTRSEVHARYVIVADGSLSGSAACSARRGTSPTHREWRFAATSALPGTPTVSSSPISTSAIATATSCPGTDGSSLSATAG